MPDSIKTPFSVVIYQDPNGGLVTAEYYGADERDLFETEIQEMRDAGFSVWAAWQPIWDEMAYKPPSTSGTFKDAYGVVRVFGTGS
jgi:hypothetical protein